ncbi:Crp/Fnr family transcriptional regulator [Lentzea sp. BCCO 10_0856]|uniref:Crp/Fnr family transcriptional regulator n=1 Tax=Lentzea miocenica TaxID=3095431 RepID=A0ABU4TAW1_9PSEU|nr:Crp/Fnr family transcriptional regulator [Lentzea sp. BCCO 10_0856]MDX8035315.1 Crp/Fnr family transcriptional regulator [Lentzea sp. BCCO 10_0856]
MSRHWLHDLTGQCAQSSFWGRLRESERSAFADVADLVRYERGSRLIHVDDPGSWVAVLCGGRVRVVAATGNRLVAIRVPGDIVGEQAVIDRHRRSATVIADSAVRAALVRAKEFEELIKTKPRLLRVVCTVISERLREATLANAGQGDAFSKLVGYLLREAETARRSTPVNVPVHIKSQQQLAALLGVSRESVVRALRRLREVGLVTTRNGVVVVSDPLRLRMLGD